MTKSHIRRAASWGWAKRSWARLHEPRIISSLYGCFYVAAVAVGIWCTISPPQTVEGVTGRLLMGMITIIIALGGVFGVVTVASGNHWVERTAPALIITGAAFWTGLTVFLQFASESGNRGLTIFAGACTVAFFALRYVWITDSPYSRRRTHH